MAGLARLSIEVASLLLFLGWFYRRFGHAEWSVARETLRCQGNAGTVFVLEVL